MPYYCELSKCASQRELISDILVSVRASIRWETNLNSDSTFTISLVTSVTSWCILVLITHIL